MVRLAALCLGRYGIHQSPCRDYSPSCYSDFRASYRFRGKAGNARCRCIYCIEKPLSLPLSLILGCISESQLAVIASVQAGFHSILKQHTANLLVVNLHVKPYNQRRDESRQFLPRPGLEGPRPSQEAWIHPRGHDLVRLLRATLATDRGWPPDYRHDVAAHLRGVRGLHGEAGARPGCWRLQLSQCEVGPTRQVIELGVADIRIVNQGFKPLSPHPN
jgi:hypothetical protein